MASSGKNLLNFDNKPPNYVWFELKVLFKAGTI